MSECMHHEMPTEELLEGWKTDISTTMTDIGCKSAPLLTDIVNRGLSLSSNTRENIRLLQHNQDGIQVGAIPTGDTSLWKYSDGSLTFTTKYFRDIVLDVRSNGESRILIPGTELVTKASVKSLACLQLYFYTEDLWNRVATEQPLIEEREVWEKIFATSTGHEPITLHLTQAIGMEGEKLVRADVYKIIMQDGKPVILYGDPGTKEISHESFLWQDGKPSGQESRNSDTSWYKNNAFSLGRTKSREPYTIKPRV